MSDDDAETTTHTMEFTVGPNVREVRDDSVEAFDNALAAIGSGEIMHAIDPRRINAFDSGGPPVWSVGTVETPHGSLYLTYGLSGMIDPAQQGRSFEMSILVPGAMTMWPPLFLRMLCRYMVTSGRDLEVGQTMPFPGPITNFYAPPQEREALPVTAMRNACFVSETLLPTIATPHGAVEVRRAIGLHPDEAQLLELWSVEGFVGVMADVTPALATDPTRESLVSQSGFVAAIEAGSRTHGSAISALATAGVAWSEKDGALEVKLPGGAQALRIRNMVRARLPFGRHLVVHDVDPQNPQALVFEPSEEPDIRTEGQTLVLSMPADHGLFDSLDNASPEGLVWELS